MWKTKSSSQEKVEGKRERAREREKETKINDGLNAGIRIRPDSYSRSKIERVSFILLW